jgi:hypothetical protein
VLSKEDFYSLLTTNEQARWGYTNDTWSQDLHDFFCGAPPASSFGQEGDLLSWFKRPYAGKDPQTLFPHWVSTSFSINATLQVAYDGWLKEGSSSARQTLTDLINEHYPETSSPREVAYGTTGCLPPLSGICATEHSKAILWHGGDTSTVMQVLGGSWSHLKSGDLRGAAQTLVDGVKEWVGSAFSSPDRICTAARNNDWTLKASNTAKLTAQYLADLKRNSKYAYAAMQAGMRASALLGINPEIMLKRPEFPPETRTQQVTAEELTRLLGRKPPGLERYPLLWLYRDRDSNAVTYTYSCTYTKTVLETFLGDVTEKKTVEYQSTVDFSSDSWGRLLMLRVWDKEFKFNPRCFCIEPESLLVQQPFSLPTRFLALLPFWYDLFLRFYEEELKKVDLSGILDPSQTLVFSRAPVVGTENFAIALVSRRLDLNPEKLLYLSFYANSGFLGKIAKDLAEGFISGDPEEAIRSALLFTLLPVKDGLCLTPNIVRFPAVLDDPFHPPAKNWGGDWRKIVDFGLGFLKSSFFLAAGSASPALLLNEQFREEARESVLQTARGADDAFKVAMSILMDLCDKQLVGVILKMMGEMIDEADLLELVLYEGFIAIATKTPDGVRIERILLPPANQYISELVQTLFFLIASIVNGDDTLFALNRIGDPAKEPTPEADALFSSIGVSPRELKKLIAVNGSMTRRQGEIQRFSVGMFALDSSPGPFPKTFRVGTSSPFTFQEILTELEDKLQNATRKNPEDVLSQGKSSLVSLQTRSGANSRSPFGQEVSNLSFPKPQINLSALYRDESGRRFLLVAVRPPEEGKTGGKHFVTLIALERVGSGS